MLENPNANDLLEYTSEQAPIVSRWIEERTRLLV